MSEACQTPMSDHIASFWRLLRTEWVRILIDIRREHAEGQPSHWDSSSFPNEVAKALVADRDTALTRIRELERDLGQYKMLLDISARTAQLGSSGAQGAQRSEAVAYIDARLEDLATANAIYGNDQRLDSPAKVNRNNREISWLKDLRSMIAHPVHSGQKTADEDWRKDPSADERWNAGLDYGMVQLCHVLGVDPEDVRWDAATETLDGDVCAAIGNVLRVKYGDDFDPTASAPSPGATEQSQRDYDHGYGIGYEHGFKEQAALVERQKRAIERVLTVIEDEWNFDGAHPHRQAVIRDLRDSIALPSTSCTQEDAK